MSISCSTTISSMRDSSSVVAARSPAQWARAQAEYEDAIGWTNGKTRFWIGPADEEGLKHKHRTGNIGFHHYAFQLRSRKDVDALQKFLEETGATIVDPAGEYYDDYYAVFFLDPDGLKLEGMKYGERHAQTTRQRAARKAKASKGRRSR